MKVRIAQPDKTYITREMTQEQLDKLLFVAEQFGQRLGYEVILK